LLGAVSTAVAGTGATWSIAGTDTAVTLPLNTGTSPTTGTIGSIVPAINRTVIPKHARR
jgi:hypothetical protein